MRKWVIQAEHTGALINPSFAWIKKEFSIILYFIFVLHTGCHWVPGAGAKFLSKQISFLSKQIPFFIQAKLRFINPGEY